MKDGRWVMTNPSMAEKPDVVHLLRQADQALSTAMPDPRLKQRLLAAVDKNYIGQSLPRIPARSWAVPALAFAALLAFVSICIDDDRAPRNVQMEVPKTIDDSVQAEPEPKSEDPEMHPTRSKHRKEKSSTDERDSTEIRQSPYSVPDLTPKTPTWPRKDAPNLAPESAPEPSIPKSRSNDVPRPHSSVRIEKPLRGVWSEPSWGYSSVPERSRTSIPSFGGGSSSVDEPRATRPQQPRNGPSETEGNNPPDKLIQEQDAPEVHVIGIYEADAGSVSVYLGRSGPAILVLSAYAATTWSVAIGPETDLQAIYVLGYEVQKLGAMPDTKVIVSSFESDGEFLGCGYEWPDMDPMSGCETPDLLGAIKVRLGLTAQSFHGCYAASSFVLADEGAKGTCAQGYPFSGFP